MQIAVVLIIFGIIAIILMALGVSFTRSGLRGIRYAWGSKAWPSTPGEIVSVTIEEQKPISEHDRHPTYRPIVAYSYSIGGKSFGGQHRKFNDDVIVYGSEEKAQAAIAQYPVGQKVKVYYEPDNPRNAVLEPGKAGPAWRTLSAGILCLVLGIIPIWIAIAVVTQNAVEAK